MRRSLPLAAKPAARLICSISPAVNNGRRNLSACSQMSLSDRLYDVVLLLTSPPVMRVFPRVACLHVAPYHRGPLRGEPARPHPRPPSLVPDQFPPSHLVAFIGQRSPCSLPPPSIAPTTQGLAKRLCLMCWQFHLAPLSLISLASSLLTVASDCLQLLHFSALPPASAGSGLFSFPTHDADAEKVNKRVGMREQSSQIGKGEFPVLSAQTSCHATAEFLIGAERSACRQEGIRAEEATAPTCLSLYVSL